MVALIDVEPADEPVYAKTTKGPNVFYVRVSNTTRVLDGPEANTYIRGRFAG